MTGYFVGTSDFGGVPLVGAGGIDIFLAKYDSSGAHQWSMGFGGISTDEGFAVTTDVSGNVIITGRFSGTADFGGGPLVSAGNNDIYLAKYDATGTHLWSQRFGGTSLDHGYSVATDASGNIFVSGYFSGTVNFGGGNLASAGFTDVFLAKYDTSGVHQWSKRFGDVDQDLGWSVAVDAPGNVIATGAFHGSVDFGGGALASAGDFDVYLAKYSPDGTHLWSKRLGSTGDDRGNSLTTDGSGNILLTGFFNGTVNFGGGGLASAGVSDVFLAKYDGGGAHVWSERFGGNSTDDAEEVATDGSDNVFITGWFQGTANFGGSNFTAVGSNDGFIAKYGADGAHRWSRANGATGGSAGFSIAADGSGNMLATGHFLGTLDFGGGDLTSAGAGDVYIAKYSTAEPAITAITDVGNDQGRRVRIHFTRSGYDDAGAANPVLAYEAYLRDDPLPSLVADAEGAAYSSAEILADGWVQVASVSAHAEEAYLMDAPTDADSTVADGQHYSVFFVRATTALPSVYYDSAPDSGYSLDNLSPGVPNNFVYAAGQLSWDESSAPDFDYFTVYGSNSDDFGSATVIDYTTALDLDVTSSPYTYYYVTATDYSGNEGDPAELNSLTGVGGTPAGYVLSISAYPNPFNPATTIRYTLPSPGHVSVAIYDARGARIATLVDADRDADVYTTRWDGRNASGQAVSSGVYFARIEHEGATRAKKLVLLK